MVVVAAVAAVRAAAVRCMRMYVDVCRRVVMYHGCERIFVESGGKI